MKGKIIIGASIFLCVLLSCKDGKRPQGVENHAIPRYVWPVPPSVLTDPAEQAAYMVGHYWQGLDYADTTWLADSAALEQVFVRWIALLAQQPVSENAKTMGNVITRGKDSPALQLRLAELAERYFHDPNSPCRNEELYIPILEAIVAAPKIEDIYKERYRYQLEKALMNRPGTRAADFAFVTRQQQTRRLSSIPGDYVLLYFFNPDCHDCKRVAAYMVGSPVLGSLVKGGHLTVLAVYPDKDLSAWEKYAHDMPGEWTVSRYADDEAGELYDLPAIPNLYLLDNDKNVILKDAPVEQIEDWLRGVSLKEDK